MTRSVRSGCRLNTRWTHAPPVATCSAIHRPRTGTPPCCSRACRHAWGAARSTASTHMATIARNQPGSPANPAPFRARRGRDEALLPRPCAPHPRPTSDCVRSGSFPFQERSLPSASPCSATPSASRPAGGMVRWSAATTTWHAMSTNPCAGSSTAWTRPVSGSCMATSVESHRARTPAAPESRHGRRRPACIDGRSTLRPACLRLIQQRIPSPHTASSRCPSLRPPPLPSPP